MSTRAVAYIKALVVCPNGEQLTRTEKLAGLVLADSHQDRAHRRTYPAIEGMAEDSMMSERHFIRMLASLERKGVIRREYPDGRGRGKTTFYFFPELDEKGCQHVTLCAVQNAAAEPLENSQKGDKRVTNQAPHILSNKYNKSKYNTPLPPASGGSDFESEESYAGKTTQGADGVAKDVVSSEENKLVFVPRDGAGSFRVACVEPASADPHREAGDVERCVESVMQACGFVELWRNGSKPGRLRRTLAMVLQNELDKGEPPQSTALAMIAAWQEYTFADTLLLARYGPAKFFQTGAWRDARSWHWDVKALDRSREARVGT